jgi:hypothetical protein
MKVQEDEVGDNLLHHCPHGAAMDVMSVNRERLMSFTMTANLMQDAVGIVYPIRRCTILTKWAPLL